MNSNNNQSTKQFFDKMNNDNVNLFSTDDVNSYIANLDVKNSTKRMYVYAISKFYKELGFESKIDELIKYKQDTNLELTALSYEQCESIKSMLKESDQNLYVVFCILLETGVRISEFVNVDWNNIDTNTIIIRTKKVDDEYRYVFVSDDTLDWIKRDDLKSWKEWTVGHIKNQFTSLSKKLGYQVSCHTLRRTFGTLLSCNNVGIDKIATLMGHKSMENTRKYYIKLNEQFQFSVAKKAWMTPLENITNETLLSNNEWLEKKNEILEKENKKLQDKLDKVYLMLVNEIIDNEYDCCDIDLTNVLDFIKEK